MSRPFVFLYTSKVESLGEEHQHDIATGEAQAKRQEVKRVAARERMRRLRADPAHRQREAKRARALRSKAPATKEENPNDPRLPAPHGTPQRYKRHGCKCSMCTMANRDSMRMYRTGSYGPERNLNEVV